MTEILRRISLNEKSSQKILILTTEMRKRNSHKEKSSWNKQILMIGKASLRRKKRRKSYRMLNWLKDLKSRKKIPLDNSIRSSQNRELKTLTLRTDRIKGKIRAKKRNSLLNLLSLRQPSRSDKGKRIIYLTFIIKAQIKNRSQLMKEKWLKLRINIKEILKSLKTKGLKLT